MALVQHAALLVSAFGLWPLVEASWFETLAEQGRCSLWSISF